MSGQSKQGSNPDTRALRQLGTRLPSLGLPFGIDVLDSIGSPFAEKCKRILSDVNRHKEYVDLSLNPKDYTSWSSFRDDYLCLELMSKYPKLNLGIDRKAAALKKFWECEELCRVSNDRIQRMWLSESYDSELLRAFRTAKRKIATLLGDFSWDEAETLFGFGPGASTRVKRSSSDVYYKFQGRPETTFHNLKLAETAIRRVPRWFQLLDQEGRGSLCTVVPGNKVVTVPKNAKTDRTIGIEPCMNMYIQKGIGSMIRSRLKKVGVNLDDQTLNQRAAKEGSLSGNLATIDLSSASDTLAWKLVEELLPPDWFAAMFYCRSHRGVLDGKIFSYHKFSSMGNGYTFELESLVFWALCAACVEITGSANFVRVYGDDIIVPVTAVRLVTEVLTFAGFKTNERKTFIDGPFRESCGKHYFLGNDVTPFFVREDIESVESLVHYLNSLRRFASGTYREMGFGCDVRFQLVWEYYRSYLPPLWQKIRIPASLFIEGKESDKIVAGGLIGNFDEAVPLTVYDRNIIRRAMFDRATFGFEGFRCKAFTKVKVLADLADDGKCVLPWLYRAERAPRRKEPVAVAVPTPRERYRLQWLLVPQWADLGPWV